jgi:hypothetical protein
VSVRLDQWVSIKPDVLATEVDDSAVLLDIESGRYFGFDPVGSDIWTRIAQPQQVDALCHDLMQRYDAPIDRIRAGVLDFLNDLAAKGLIVVRAE